jgi:hypothetical protein
MAQNYISYTYDPVLKRASVPIGAGASGGSDGGGAIEAKSRPKGPAPAGSPAKAAVTTGRSASKTAPAPPANQGRFVDRLRAQAAEAKAQADRAQQEKAARAQGNTKPAKAPPERADAGAASDENGAGRGGAGRGGAGRRRVASGNTASGNPAAADEAAADEAAAEAAAVVPEATPDAEPEQAQSGSGSGNGTPRAPRQPNGASPLKVTRPSGRVTPPKGQPGRRPRKGQ